MPEHGDLEERLIALESLLTHQEGTIRDISDMVRRQWETIDGLLLKLKRVEERLIDLRDTAGSEEPGDRPPPHY
ncbi:MAG: SlyX family protein [Proteobacteria bacterium]|jgi:SlyX protein|nr:SlyX family protein [Pseudomonadota bacterium]